MSESMTEERMIEAHTRKELREWLDKIFREIHQQREWTSGEFYDMEDILALLDAPPAPTSFSHDNDDRIFIGHISNHLKPGERVICKICGKTADRIIEEERGVSPMPTNVMPNDEEEK